MLSRMPITFNKHQKMLIKSFLTVALFVITVAGFGQNLPSDAQVIKDISGYHGKIESAKLNGDWQLVRESGYNFANTAKHPVASITKKDASGIQKKLQGLAIYTRGSASSAWRFSRYFMYDSSTEIVGAKMPSKQEMISIVEKSLSEIPRQVYNECDQIIWMYSISIPDSIVFKQNAVDKMLFAVEFEYEIKYHGLTERRKQVREVNCRKENGNWMVHYCDDVASKLISQRNIPQSTLENTPGIGERPFREIYGPEGPNFSSSKGATGLVGDKIKGLFKKN